MLFMIIENTTSHTYHKSEGMTTTESLKSSDASNNLVFRPDLTTESSDDSIKGRGRIIMLPNSRVENTESASTRHSTTKGMFCYLNISKI